MRTTQDDARENGQIEIFELNATKGRSNKYIPDATLQINGETVNIELKTSDEKRKRVSTGRDVNLTKLDNYRSFNWIFSQYRKTKDGFEFTGEHYFARGKDLEPWFAKQEKKIREGTKTYAGYQDWEDCKTLLEGRVDKIKLDKLDYNFQKKGCALNDPSIAWSEIEKLGTRLDPDNLAGDLRRVLVS